jgi:antirestriction protein ArdC
VSNKFLTFKQANDLGGKVRKGERSTRVIFLKFLPKEGEEKQVPVTRIYNVFSVSQVDGLPDSLYGHEEPLPEDERLEGLRELVKASGIRVQYSAGTQPAYFPGADYVAMNQYGDYTSDDDFASTLFHEFTHATMHKDRLNRDLKGRMWPDPRAAEECVAELGAAFLCAHLGFDYVKAQSPAYIESWLKVLKADTRALFSLASHASHAADWLRERTHAVTDETPECERAA